jgi:5-(aminomethyl)-3-furanmethanol phosphate kinase
MILTKVGGSLLGWKALPGRVLDYLRSLPSREVVLVAGGSAVGDFLRELDSVHAIGEKRVHSLALHALDLTAHVLATLLPGSVVVERPSQVRRALESGLVPVLAPRWFMENIDRTARDSLPETWETTTDSIAARLASHFEADELVLLKSTLPEGALDRIQASRAGFVDPEFPRASSRFRRVRIVNLRADPVAERELD